MKSRHTLALIVLTVSLTGCATKHYGRQGILTNYEKSSMDCKEIGLELAKVNGYIRGVDEESGFDARSVLSFATDFGIGNVMEKRAALKSAKKRKLALEDLSVQRSCTWHSPDR
jgi:hypothetical protein